MEPIMPRARVRSDPVRNGTIEIRKIYSDENIRFALPCQINQSPAKTAKGGVFFQNVGQPGDRMLGHIKGHLDTSRSHVFSASAEEARFQSGCQRLIIARWLGRRGSHFITD